MTIDQLKKRADALRLRLQSEEGVVITKGNALDLVAKGQRYLNWGELKHFSRATDEATESGKTS